MADGNYTDGDETEFHTDLDDLFDDADLDLCFGNTLETIPASQPHNSDGLKEHCDEDSRETNLAYDVQHAGPDNEDNNGHVNENQLAIVQAQSLVAEQELQFDEALLQPQATGFELPEMPVWTEEEERAWDEMMAEDNSHQQHPTTPLQQCPTSQEDMFTANTDNKDTDDIAGFSQPFTPTLQETESWVDPDMNGYDNFEPAALSPPVVNTDQSPFEDMHDHIESTPDFDAFTRLMSHTPQSSASVPTPTPVRTPNLSARQEELKLQAKTTTRRRQKQPRTKKPARAGTSSSKPPRKRKRKVSDITDVDADIDADAGADADADTVKSQTPKRRRTTDSSRADVDAPRPLVMYPDAAEWIMTAVEAYDRAFRHEVQRQRKILLFSCMAQYGEHTASLATYTDAARNYWLSHMKNEEKALRARYPHIEFSSTEGVADLQSRMRYTLATILQAQYPAPEGQIRTYRANIAYEVFKWENELMAQATEMFDRDRKDRIALTQIRSRTVDGVFVDLLTMVAIPRPVLARGAQEAALDVQGQAGSV